MTKFSQILSAIKFEQKVIFRSLLLIISIMFMGLIGQAQTKTVSGKITDGVNPLSGATVQGVGTKTSVKTKSDGSFSIAVAIKTSQLSISYVGYSPKIVSISGDNIGEVELEKGAKKEDEVIVTGYQIRKKKDEAGAITTIKMGDISDRPNMSVDKALQGAAAGVTVQASNGIPGGSIRINIRGQSSYGSTTQPLWVIDGVIFPSNNSSSFTQTNPLASINQSDIETLDILKDAASTAIYGSAGANGVVLVTTKKGKAGKTKVKLNLYSGFNDGLSTNAIGNSSDIINFRARALLNTSINGASTANATWDAARLSAMSSMGVPIAGLTTSKQIDDAVVNAPYYDWQKEIFQKGVIKNAELSISGGNEKTTFYTSASYNYTQAPIKKVDFKRGTFKFDVTNKVTDKLKVNVSANLGTIYQQVPFATDGAFLGNPAFSSQLVYPTNPIRNADGTYFQIATPSPQLYGTLSHNVALVSDYNNGYDRTNTLLLNASAEYKIAPWLTLKSLAGIDYRVNNGRRTRDPRTPDGANGPGGSSTVTTNLQTNIITTQTLAATKKFDKHTVDGVVGFEYQSVQQEGSSANATGFPSYQLVLLSAGSTPVSITEYFNENKKNSVLGQINYVYDSRYSISFAARYNGSSRFSDLSPKTQYGFFPSVKGVWNVDNEKFMANSKTVTTLRLRGSFGTSGNDLGIGNYEARNLVGTGGLYNGSSSLLYSQLGNAKLSWEKVKETNIGIDLGFWNNVKLTVDVYDKRTTGILQNVLLQNITGWNSIRLNSGKVSNKGIEFGLSADIIKPKRAGDFAANFSFNIAYNKNSIDEIVNGTSTLNSLTSTLLGKPIGQVLTSKFAGVNSATGRPMWFDSLNNITYIPRAKDQYYAGIGIGGLPPISGGLQGTISFRGISISTNFSYQYGQIASDGQFNFLAETQGRFNTSKENILKAWTTPGQITNYPRPLTAAETNSSLSATGDRLFMKTDFIRLKNIEVQYDLSSTLLKKYRITNIQLYAQGQNLFTHTSFKGYDPEFTGTATGIVPQFKSVTFGANITF